MRTLAIDAYRLFLCAIVGVVTGLIAIAFRWLVGSIEGVLAQGAHSLYSAHHPLLAKSFLVISPAFGGAVVGLLVYRLVRVHAGHGVPAVITAAARDTPMTDWRLGFKASTSVVTIGSGGSAGPEGPIVELGAVVGSFFWKYFKLPGPWVRIMMGCGAAAGIAAIFNVPLGGVIFVLDVVLRDHSSKSLLPLMIASMAASTINRYAGTPAILLPECTLTGNEMIWAPLLGLMAGVASTFFIRANFFAADAFSRIKMSAWLRPALGGACVGLISLTTLHATGEGYDSIQLMIQHAISAPIIILAVLGIAVARVIATACTLGSGGTGGAFAPSLVIGTAVGLSLTGAIAVPFPSLGVDPVAFALAGMGGLLAGVFQAPLSGLVIAFNLSRWNAQLLLPLMCVTMISAWLSQHLARASIYELKLLREGVDLAASRSLQAILAGRGIHDIMHKDIESIPRSASLSHVIDSVCSTNQSIFPVVDSDRFVIGMIRLSELRSILRETHMQNALIAEDVMRPVDKYLGPTDSLARAWAVLLETHDDDVLILDRDLSPDHGSRPVGLLRRAEVLKHLKWT